MKDDGKKYRDRIPSRDLTAYERWELPALDEQGNEISNSRIEEREMKPLTAGELERIRQEAWEDGQREGRTEGFDKGYREGRDAGYADGEKTGLEEGREKGRQEALEQTREDVQAGLQRLENLMSQLLKPLEQQRDALETVVLNLATALARAVVYRELTTDSSHIRTVIGAALNSLPDTAEQVAIHVNPQDLEWAQEAAERVFTGSRVVADSEVLAGGCRVESRNSLVDFTVEKRFQKTLQQMLDRQLSRGDAGESSGELDALMGELTDFHRDVLEEPDEAPIEPDPPSPGNEPDEGTSSGPDAEPEAPDSHE